MNTNISGAIEALLFIYGEPLGFGKMAEILGISENQVKEELDSLDQLLKDGQRGLKLIFQGSKVQLATKPDFSAAVEKIIKDEYEESLTPAALETLSLVGYLGPISRSQIDYYRGVNSSYTLRNLMMRGLVEKDSESKNSYPALYRVTFDFMKHLGISKVEELPDYHRFQSVLVAEGGGKETGNLSAILTPQSMAGETAETKSFGQDLSTVGDISDTEKNHEI